MSTILDEIVARCRLDLAERVERVPMAELERRIQSQAPALDFAAALSVEGTAVIAEVKEASPSRGTFRADFDPLALARQYAAGGAAALSVLTEQHYFKGSLERLPAVRESVAPVRNLPLLRKDFLFTPYLFFEARAYGADSVLVLCSILEPGEVRNFVRLARSLGMEPLVEVHDEAELDTALEADALVIGINNRDLRTFSVDLATTERLARRIPSDRILVSESGIFTPEDVRRVRDCGARAVLVGEALVVSGDPTTRVRELSACR